MTIPKEPSLPKPVILFICYYPLLPKLFMHKARSDLDMTLCVPINKCFISYPVLSLRKVPSMSRTVPSASTTSSPEIYKQGLKHLVGEIMSGKIYEKICKTIIGSISNQAFIKKYKI